MITSAVSTQDWPGEAAVDVSIVNWVREPNEVPSRLMLDGVDVDEITAALRVDQIAKAAVLKANRGRAFQGVVPGANYFVDQDRSERFLADHPEYADVMRPFLTGDDVATDPEQRPSRYIVDFGLRELEEAMQYPEALKVVQLQARRDRERSSSYGRNPRWWQFLWPRPVFRHALADLPRFIVGTRVGKRILFVWVSPLVCPSDGTNAFALSDDASIGLLSSGVHIDWARAQSSTLENRIRYTPTSAFDTYPWPAGDRDEIADVSRRLYACRSEICLERQIGLTKLYNQVDDGAWRGLADLHAELDEAVAAAYGWPRSVAHDPDETNRRLLELNRQIAAGEREYHPFG